MGKWISLPLSFPRKHKKKLDDILADGINFLKEHKVEPIPMYEVHIKMANGKQRRFFMTKTSNKFYLRWEIIPESQTIIDISEERNHAT